MTHEWTDRLSDYLDDHLDVAERLLVEAHIADCDMCARTLEELRAVTSRAGDLTDAEPRTDLWAGIRQGIDAEPRGPSVIELAPGRVHESRAPRRISISIPQLVAAGLALVFLSSGGALLLSPDSAVSPGGAVIEPGLGLPVRSIASVVVDGSTGTDSQAAELAELQELLARHQGDLSPNTVRILQKNLAAIDRAIEESLQALAVDPGNTYLEGHVERSYEKKLEYLREASTTFQWST